MSDNLIKRERIGDLQISDCQIDSSGEESRGDDQTADLHDKVVVESDIKSTACTADVSNCFTCNQMYSKKMKGFKGEIGGVPMPPRTKTVEKNHVRYFKPSAK
jgi:hypothetical protein